MHLLIVTQKVDATDSTLGFFVHWIKRFSEYADITVIANEVGPYDLPTRVRVFSLGKEREASRLSRLLTYRRLLREHLPKVDGVFFHMCPEYVIAASFLPKRFGKKSVLWYTHKKVSWRLRLALWFVDVIFTASKESFRLYSEKVRVAGHGVDSKLFSRLAERPKHLRLITVGRISRVKDLTTLLCGFAEIKQRSPDAEFLIAGEAVTAGDRRYQVELQTAFPSLARFVGAIQYRELPAFLSGASAFLHASRTGSIDKAVLEALASGLFVVTSSEAFSSVIPGVFTFKNGDPLDLARALLRAAGEVGRYNEAGREWVKTHHELSTLISRIISFYA